MQVIKILCKNVIVSLLLVMVIHASISANNINTGGHNGVVRSMSAQSIGKTGINYGASFKYDRDYDYVSGPQGTGSVENFITGLPVSRNSPHIMSGDFYCAYGLFDFLDISINLPLYFDIPGWDEKKRAGLGDLECATLFTHPFHKSQAVFTNAYYLKITFPTGKQERGYFPRHSYYQTDDGTTPGKNQYTANDVLFIPMLLWTFDFTRLEKGFPLQFHINFGGSITRVKNSSALIASISAEYTPISLLSFFIEMSGEARVKYYTENFRFHYFENDPLLLSPGMRFNFPFGLYTTISGDFGLSSMDKRFRSSWKRGNYSFSTSPVPRFGFQMTVGWKGIIKEPDYDGDGLIDIKDKCPEKPEDKDGYMDEDGCPDLDNDSDGITDTNDKCPNEPAKPSQCDGCPIYDMDEDGLEDKDDKCPKEPEDKDGFMDDDGCPDFDNDKDGIKDANDACPDKPEDLDGFEDSDGCIDPDNDGDGINDLSDSCPNIVGVAEAGGCPKTKEIKRGKLILEGVNFRSGKSILTPNSYRILDQVYESLAEWINVKLEIRGYTDSQGNDQSNKRLSQKRAEAVMIYLIQKGIQPNRLRAVGYGEDNPIADNSTAAGRARNRRVELNRID
ncbi:MAG: OmpA family protein [Chitinispirillia bacterium]|jgi:outer membrane protein OmpA-like peptidoglycan-associated protein